MLKDFLLPKYTDYVQIIIFFCIGLFSGPISNGLIYLIISILIWEALIIWVTDRLKPGYKFATRIALNVSFIVGWLLGRWLYLGYIGYDKFITLMSKL